MRHAISTTVLLALLTWPLPSPAAPAKLADLSSFLEPFRAKHELPALAAAVIVGGKVKAVGAVGVRKHGADVAVTVDDRFHLGSCTKAMTATLLAKLVEDGKLSWDTTLADAFPDLAEGMHAGFRGVTLRHLVCHRAGLPHESWPVGMNFLQVHGLAGSPREQRYEYARRMLAQKPEHAPGSKYVYSNAGFAIAGAVAERVMDKPWETLMEEVVFAPLGITSAGFGAMGTPGEINQPWQHRLRAGGIVPLAPGRFADNPPAIAPAGTAHMTVGDWAKFVAEHVRGGKKRQRLLKRSTYRTIHSAPFGGNYAFGWNVTQRPWANGDALNHTGSNNSNFAVVWASPKRGFAVVVMTNVAGDTVPKSCDEVVWALIQKFLVGK